MPDSPRPAEARRLVVLGEIDPEVTGASDDATQSDLRHLLPLEVARIARSMGHEVTVVAETKPPALEAEQTEAVAGDHEPWMHGIDWREPASNATDTASDDTDGESFEHQQLAVISLAGWMPDLGVVRGDIDDPVVQSMTTLADALAAVDVERVVFVDVDTSIDDERRDLRRNTRRQLESLLRDEKASEFASSNTQLSFVVGAGPLWTQRDALLHADTDDQFDRLLDEAEQRAESDDYGDRLEEVAIAALRTTLDDEHRPNVDGHDIGDLGKSVFVQ